MLANQTQYHFLLKTQRHLLGQHGYTKWSPSHVISNICNLTFPWEAAIHKAFCGDHDPDAVIQYISHLRHSPTYYRNLTTAPTKEFIATEITNLRRTNQTRRNQDRADNATEYRQMLRDTYENKNTANSSNCSLGTSLHRWTHTTSQVQKESISPNPSTASKQHP